jgi:serine protease Do
MKTKFIPALFALAFSLTAFSGYSQKNLQEDRNQEQIVISRSPLDSGKTVIEIDSNVITINGKPMADYKGDVKVFKRNFVSGEDDRFFAGMSQNFMFQDNAEGAFLGVISAKTDKGAIINNVLDNSSAKKAGLEKGDIITQINDDIISSPADLKNSIESHKPGDEVTIQYLRDNKKMSVKLELGKTPANVQSFNGLNEDLLNKLQNGNNFRYKVLTMQRGNFDFNFNNDRPRLGLQIQDTQDSNGVKIQKVLPGSPAEKAGLKEGDIITEMNGEKINDVDKIQSEIRNSENKTDYKVKALRNQKEMKFDIKVHRPLKTTNI